MNIERLYERLEIKDFMKGFLDKTGIVRLADEQDTETLTAQGHQVAKPSAVEYPRAAIYYFPERPDPNPEDICA